MLLNKCELKITVYTKNDKSKLKLFFKMRQQNDSQNSALIRYRINFRHCSIMQITYVYIVCSVAEIRLVLYTLTATSLNETSTLPANYVEYNVSEHAFVY